MSTGGVFRLIINDGKVDKLITATEMLSQRIQEISSYRASNPQHFDDPTPTLCDLEQTHVLYMNAHFKPFASIRYEYQKVKPQVGNPQLGNHFSYSIPQFGDFFHDMVARQVLSPIYSDLKTAPVQGTVSSGPGGAAIFPNDGVDWDNTTTATLEADTNKVTVTYSLVDPFGRPVAAGADYRNMVKYVDYPGEALFQKVAFNVNGNPLDEYFATTINMLRKFTISTDKLTGYKRLVGQEVPYDGYSSGKLADVRNYNQTSKTAVHRLNLSEDADEGATPVVTAEKWLINEFPSNTHDVALAGTTAKENPNAPLYQDVIREKLQMVNGFQTPKYYHGPLEIFNALRFWFNDDVRLSIPSVSIPFGQRYIEIDLADQARLVCEAPGLYVCQKIVIEDDFNEILGVTGARAFIRKTTTTDYRPYWTAGTINDITLSNVELYVNNIFVNPDIHEIFIRRVMFSLIRVFRYHTTVTNTADSDEIQLTQLKWPIEYLFIGYRPTWNVSASNPQRCRDWHMFSRVLDIEYDNQNCTDLDSIYVVGTVGVGAAPADGIAVDTRLVGVCGQVCKDTYSVHRPVVSNITISAHGINLHDNFPSLFFNSYNPLHYGGTQIVTPDDSGVLMVNFSLLPRTYNPNGHINISRAREFFLRWTTSYTSPDDPVEVSIVAVAINFLFINDGSATLRYST